MINYERNLEMKKLEEYADFYLESFKELRVLHKLGIASIESVRNARKDYKETLKRIVELEV